MALFCDERTGFGICDPERNPFEGSLPSREDVLSALDSMILSASGWRKVFAADGDEESRSEILTPADTYLAAAMAHIFTDFVITQTGKQNPLLVVGMDARFTGPAIADAMLRILTARNIRVRYLFITAAPEIMGYVGASDDADGFIYISASHNPIGHNGVKFGLNNGGVLDGAQAKRMISLYKEFLADESSRTELRQLASRAEPSLIREILAESPDWKREAEGVYMRFTAEVISGLSGADAEGFLSDHLKKGIEHFPLGVVAELNGSARGLSIDDSFLKEWGIRVLVENGRPREIAHRIVPEGDSLNLCKEILEQKSAEDKAYQLGYVPDNDGDRGNLVYLNSSTGRAEILEAQEVFALSVLAELAYLDWSGQLNEKTAVVVNGPTSMRIDEIAGSFGCTVFRAEVGEANVVNLAREKRDEGWQVRILGEGSNGGNITFPSSVRDPLNTLGALIKLLSLRTEGTRPGLFHLWCRRRGQEELYAKDFDLTHVLSSLPEYVTTSAYETRALMQIRRTDHAVLKARYEEIFLKEWEEKHEELEKRFGILSWEEWNQEGVHSVCGFGPEFRTGEEKGGLTIRFLNREQRYIGYLWMRGSGTEPVFRVLVDWKGEDRGAEDYLLEWHKRMIKKADA